MYLFFFTFVYSSYKLCGNNAKNEFSLNQWKFSHSKYTFDKKNIYHNTATIKVS